MSRLSSTSVSNRIDVADGGSESPVTPTPSRLCRQEKNAGGWCLGIARSGGMKWGKKAYPSPEAAVFQACRVVDDIALADMLADTMLAGEDDRVQEIEKRIKRFKEGNK